MHVLLSIRPKYVERIVSGSKKYEFRRTIFKSTNVNEIYIYSTSPVQKIIGTITIEEIIKDSPESLWQNCKDHAGIDSEDFFKYFDGRDEGFAIKIEHVRVFDEPVNPKDCWPDFIPPQSFRYINEMILVE